MLEYRQASLLSPEEERSTLGNRRGAVRRWSKLFFVLRPEASIRRAMHDAASRHAQRYGKNEPRPANLLHLSLLNVGAFERPPYDLANRMTKAVDRIAARPIRIRLDRSALYGNGRHLVLASSRENPELQAFVRILHTALSRYNLPRAAKISLSPHVTVIYGYGASELLPVESEYAWLSRDFALIYSHDGEGRHEELGRWRLDFDAAPYSVPPEQLRLFS